MGTTSHMVALGHGSAEVTRRHYIRPGAAEQASQTRLEQLIECGDYLRNLGVQLSSNSSSSSSSSAKTDEEMIVSVLP
jgi:hypothetical protein